MHARGPSPSAADAVHSFVAALARFDLDALVASFDENATVFMPLPSMPDRLEGREAIRAAFASMFDQARASGTTSITLNVQKLRVDELGDVAVATFDVGAGAAISRRTVVLRRVVGGWRVVHLHASNVRR